MRPDDHVVHRIERRQRMTFARQRLAAIDIQRHAAKVPGLQRGQQRRLVDQLAARHIDQPGAGFHAGQLARADQVPRLAVQHAVQRYRVTALEHLTEVNAALDRHVGRVRVVTEHLHAKGLCHASHRAADAPHADEAERLAGEVARHPAWLGPGPAGAVHRVLDRLETLGQREQQRERAFGHRLLGIGRHVDHGYAPFPGSVDVDRVDADAVLDDRTQLRRRLDHAARDARVAHQQQVGIGHRVGDTIFRRAIGQQHQLGAEPAQVIVDATHLEFAIGAHDLPAWCHLDPS